MKSPLSMYQGFIWGLHYKKMGRYKKPKRLYVIRKYVFGKGYGYWRGPDAYGGHTFSDIKYAHKFRTYDGAMETAENSSLYRHCTYGVEQVK